MTAVKIGPLEVQLRVPSSYAEMWDVIETSQQSPTRALFAALGICWPANTPWPGKSTRVPTLVAHRFNSASYGGAVLDDLHRGKIRMSEATAAATEAFGLVVENAVDEADVEALDADKDFSAPGGVPSTAFSSTSNKPGEGPQDG